MTSPIRHAALTATVAAFLTFTSSGLARAEDPARGPGVSPYQLMTPGDLLLSRLLEAPMAGEVDDWVKALLAGLPEGLIGPIGRYFDARALAGVITETFPVESQPALGPVDRLVAGCADALGVAKPEVHVRDAPEPRAYSVRAGGRDHLVLTSRLLDLFAQKPDELRFVVGRELGHLACGHGGLRAKGYAVVRALRTVDELAVPEKFREALPALALARLVAWCRESEVSADRAGLLCCDEPGAAYQAVVRLQHGLRPDSPWLDPAAGGLDPEAAARGLSEAGGAPLFRLVLDLKRQSLEQPFYQERLAAMRAWVDSGAYRPLRARPTAGPTGLIELVAIEAYELAPTGKAVNPYVVAYDGPRRVLRTATGSRLRSAAWRDFRNADPGVDQPRPTEPGRPLFFEIWDDGYVSDSLVGGFVVYPDARDAASGKVATYTARILWDWTESSPVARPGYARVTVRFTDPPPRGAGAAPGGSSR